MEGTIKIYTETQPLRKEFSGTDTQLRVEICDICRDGCFLSEYDVVLIGQIKRIMFERRN